MRDFWIPVLFLVCAVLAALVAAVCFKSYCIDKIDFFCWSLREIEFWLERYQTLLTGVIAIGIGYASIRQMRDQMLKNAIENNRRIKLIVSEKTEVFFNRLSRDISQAYSTSKLVTDRIEAINDIKLPLIVVEPEQYVALNNRGRHIVIEIRENMRECKARLVSVINQKSDIKSVQVIISEMKTKSVEIAKNIPVDVHDDYICPPL